ncbi:hypothetical protein BT96DRAFT_920037 [Gymnopus androsaceus JB14]|uniref:Uncharacterized protein n=1 Tax=Gymnopus androsaceus JB14 TaxID=1447944 RepID=A0A6A4HMG7_9AGAR|nr:hypothetical protein BT96DRAFT_920037 [Gymnopus androsaceus JB14]
MPVIECSLSSFPMEILEAFVDCLADDRTTLFITSQVSKTMLIRSRHHLFSTIYLSSKQPFHAVPQFLSILESSWSTVGPAVSKLVLNAAFTIFEYGDPEIGQAVPSDTVDNINWPKVLGHLTALKSIRWTNEIWNLVLPEFRSILFQPTIEHLELGCFVWTEEMDLVEFLCRLPPSLSSARFEHLTLLRTPPAVKKDVYPTRNIHLTALDAYTIILLRHLFFSSKSQFTVNSMTIPLSDIHGAPQVFKQLPDVCPIVASALGHFGPNLQELTYILPDFRMILSFIEDNGLVSYTKFWTKMLNTSPCNRLHTFCIRAITLHHLNRPQISAAYHELTRQILQALPAPALLHVIKLGITLYCPANLSSSEEAVAAFPWRELAEILVSSSFQSLNEVQVEIGKFTFGYSPINTAFYFDWILKKGFHLLQEHGIMFTVHKADCQQWIVSNHTLFSGLDQEIWCDPNSHSLHSGFSYPLSMLLLDTDSRHRYDLDAMMNNI